MGSAWAVDWVTGEAAAFHARSLSEPAERTVSVLEVASPALVLGSTQSESDVAPPALEAAGVALVHRRSGGGAVLLVPGGSLWVDVVVPRHDDVWDDDVGRAVHWLGRAWRAALADVGVDGGVVHTASLVTSRWSPLVCFAGVGPGEVCVGGRKAVGISQRRSRSGARFQCLLLRRWDPAPLLGLLALSPADQQRGGVELADIAVGLDLPPTEVVDALVARLPT
jgi:lipoate-protein ligase A